MMQRTTQSRRGISLAETVISTLLIGFVLVSTLQIVAPITRSGTIQADRLIAADLASELTDEISTKLWTSPILDDPESMGPDAGETRPTYDDIDDYHGWSASPPKFSIGSSYTHLTGWKRSAKVTHATIDNPSVDSAKATGLKRVVVTVSKNNVVLAQVTSLHSSAADVLGFVVPLPVVETKIVVGEVLIK